MKITQISLLFFVFLIIPPVFSQTKQIDSLHKLYVKYQYNNLSKAEEYAREGVLLSKKTTNDTLLLKSNDNLLSLLIKQKK